MGAGRGHTNVAEADEQDGDRFGGWRVAHGDLYRKLTRDSPGSQGRIWCTAMTLYAWRECSSLPRNLAIVRHRERLFPVLKPCNHDRASYSVPVRMAYR